MLAIVPKPRRKSVAPSHPDPQIEGWIDDLVPPSESGAVTLAYAKERNTVLLKAAIADLSSGGYHVRKLPGNDRGPCFRFEGRNHWIHVKPRLGNDTGRQIAAIVDVNKNKFPGKVLPVLKGDILIAPLWDEPECDLQDLATTCKKMDRSRARAFDQLTRPCAFEPESGQLHSAIRKRYGALMAVYDLLEQRVTVEEAAEVLVTISSVDPLTLPPGDDKNSAADDPPEKPVTRPGPVGLKLAIDQWNDSFEAPCRIELLTADGDSLGRAAIRDDDRETRSLFVESRSYPEFVTGARLRLRLIPRFVFQKHRDALRNLLRESVTGYWADLARLLVEPEKFGDSGASPELEFFCESEGVSLNEAQRTAVRGAVGTPHAYLIQGPPGTGKTTVIAEIVRQLVDRGERILLLAPTHVAVDEVLRRIGHKPGVYPLRMAWNEDLVDAELRQFTVSHLRKSVLKRLSERVDLIHRKQWDEERQTLGSRAGLLAEGLALEASRRSVGERSERANSELTDFRRSSADRVTLTSRELESARMHVVESRRELDTASAKADAAAATAHQHRRNATRLQKIGGLVGLGTLGTVQREAGQALWGKTEAEAKLNRACSAEAGAADTSHQAVSEQKLKTPELESAAKAAKAEHEFRAAEWSAFRKSFPDAAALESEGGRAEAVSEVAGARARIDRLGLYEFLHGKWQGLVGESEVTVDDNLVSEILGMTNLFCATTAGVGGDPLTRDLEFDTLIVDEASRVTDGEFLIGANRTRRWILVGDEKQLPPYVEQTDEHWLHALTAIRKANGSNDESLDQVITELGSLWEEEEELHRFRGDSVRETADRLLESGLWRDHFAEPYESARKHLRSRGIQQDQELLRLMRDQLVRSLFERVVTKAPGSLRNRLGIQRRMVEPLDQVVRDPVYDGDYRSPEGGIGLEPLLHVFGVPLVFLDTSVHGKRAAEQLSGSGFICPLEAAWVVEVCLDFDRELRESDRPPITVSILCFYRAQAREIRSRLGGPVFPQFQKIRFQVIDAIDRIQGQESELVIISFGRSRPSKRPLSPQFGLWLQDIRRLNVACTRARRALVLVGHAQTLERLESRPEARRFYRNLFSIFDHPDIKARRINDYGGGKSTS